MSIVQRCMAQVNGQRWMTKARANGKGKGEWQDWEQREPPRTLGSQLFRCCTPLGSWGPVQAQSRADRREEEEWKRRQRPAHPGGIFQHIQPLHVCNSIWNDWCFIFTERFQNQGNKCDVSFELAAWHMWSIMFKIPDMVLIAEITATLVLAGATLICLNVHFSLQIQISLYQKSICYRGLIWKSVSLALLMFVYLFAMKISL